MYVLVEPTDARGQRQPVVHNPRQEITVITADDFRHRIWSDPAMRLIREMDDKIEAAIEFGGGTKIETSCVGYRAEVVRDVAKQYSSCGWRVEIEESRKGSYIILYLVPK